MPIRLRCKCGQTLTAPDGSSGKKGKCSHCGAVFVVPDPNVASAPAAAPITEQQDDFGLSSLGGGANSLFDEALPADAGATLGASSVMTFTPQKRSSRGGGGGSANMGTVATAFKLMYWAVIGMLLSAIAMFGIIIMAGQGFGPPGPVGPGGAAAPPKALLLILPLGLVIIVCGIMMIISKIMCLGVPEQVGAKGLIISSLVCDLISFCINMGANTGAIPPEAALVAGLLGIASFITFTLFQKRLAAFIGRDDLEKKAMLVLKLAGITTFVYLTGFAAIFVAGPIGGFVVLIAFLLAITWFYYYLKLLQGLAYGL